MKTSRDYISYHGHAYPWIGFEELTNWPADDVYRVMMSCSRSTVVGMPRKYRSTCNPYGKGHNWVKARWRLPILPGHTVGPIIVDAETGLARVAVHGDMRENVALMRAEPDYTSKITMAARSQGEREAWLAGSWDIVSGGMCDDLWSPRHHVVPDLPLDRLPAGWRVDRSYDHGSSKPFSVGWWAESNGEPWVAPDGRVVGPVKGDLVRVAEWYGWSGNPNQGLRMAPKDIARGILDRERAWGMAARVRPGPADGSIFDAHDDPDKTVAGDMATVGVRWEPADRSAGSRKNGWERVRQLLTDAVPRDGKREGPGLFACERCEQFRRLVPSTPRDERDPDDVDTDSEDHLLDEVRYRTRALRKSVGIGRFK